MELNQRALVEFGFPLKYRLGVLQLLFISIYLYYTACSRYAGYKPPLIAVFPRSNFCPLGSFSGALMFRLGDAVTQ